MRARLSSVVPATVLIVAAIVSIAMVANASAAPDPNTRVKASGFNLQLDGKPFAIKGMNYSPVPIGSAPGVAPYGDFFVPTYANVWKPDIDKIREAGVNVIKLYAGNPDLNAGAPRTAGNWKDFLDYCWNSGTDPVYVVMFSYTQGDLIAKGGDDLKAYKSQYAKMVKSTVKHPAVFGYIIGNEIFDGVTGDAQFWKNFGALIDTAQEAGVSQGERPFLMSAIKDDYTAENNWPAIKLGEQSGKLKNLDAWAINVYRGPELGGSGDPIFTQYLGLMKSLPSIKKPLIIGEWGTPHTTRPGNIYGQSSTQPVTNLDDVPESDMGTGHLYYEAVPVATFLNTQWSTIKANLRAGNDQVCVGGFIFEWCDEFWKGGNNSMQVGGPDAGFQGRKFAGGYWDEAGFGITSSVDQSLYNGGPNPISRSAFKGYEAVKTFYNGSSHDGGELYHPAPRRP